MSELILHVGTPKTGTTSLQQFFYLNRDQLAERGVAFPLFPQAERVPPGRNGHILAGGILEASRAQYKPDPTYEGALATVKRSLISAKTVLISEECLSLWWAYLDDAETGRRRFAQTLANYLEDCGVTHTTIVMYLRRQDEYLASLYKQRVRDWQERATLEDFLQRFARTGDYAGYIDELERAFGSTCSFAVRRYSRDSFVGGSIYHDFFDAAGLRWSDDIIVPRHEQNPSITFDATAALLPYVNRDDLGQTEIRALKKAVDTYSALHPDPPHTTPFSLEAQTQLLAEFAQGNRSIADRFFGGASIVDEQSCASEPRWVADPARIGECREYLEAALVAARQSSPASTLKIRLVEVKAALMRRVRRFMGGGA